MTSDPEELLDRLKQRLEVEEFFPYQLEFFAGVQEDTSPRVRACLYHRTGVTVHNHGVACTESCRVCLGVA